MEQFKYTATYDVPIIDPIIDIDPNTSTIDLPKPLCYSNEFGRSNAQLSNFSYEKMLPFYIEYIEVQRSLREEWGDYYKNIMKELLSLVENNKLIEDSSKVFKKYKLYSMADMMERNSKLITNQTDFFYTLSNFLSKYPEIDNSKSKSYLSIVDDNKISLLLLKNNNCMFRGRDYIAKLNLVFTPENKVNFSSSESNGDNYLIYGTFNSPKSFFSNRKIKKLLRILDE